MDNVFSFRIHGDISHDVIKESEEMLYSSSLPFSISIGDIERSSNFFPDYELIVATAGAITAVLAFAFELFKYRRERKQTTIDLNQIIKEKMETFKVTSFELIEIQGVDDFINSITEECRAVIRDIPTNDCFEIKINASYDFTFKRKP